MGMQADFWHRKWANNDIAFHGRQANPLLLKHFGKLSLPSQARVFLPLCGKSLDIAWLLANGHRVVGAELSQLAIEQLFKELGLTPKVSEHGKLTRYSEHNIDIFVGDFFDLSATLLGPVDAVYDRAALVALPPNMRAQYAQHLMTVSATAPQLLICFDYDQSLQAGPPFSVPGAEVAEHYGGTFDITLLDTVDIPGGLKGKCAAQENVWLLAPRQ